MKALRLFVIRFLAQKTLNIVTIEDVLRVVGRGLALGESRLTDEEAGILKEESSALLNSILWKYIKRNIEYVASQKLGREAKSKEDIIAGNMMFYNLQIIEEFISRLKKL
jgi:hypothetical protein